MRSEKFTFAVYGRFMQIRSHIVTFGLKTSLHVLREHNGTKTEFYQTNTKSQGLVPAHFALINIIIVVHVVKHQSVLINTCRINVPWWAILNIVYNDAMYTVFIIM